jgi:hypothetical protein
MCIFLLVLKRRNNVNRKKLKDALIEFFLQKQLIKAVRHTKTESIIKLE